MHSPNTLQTALNYYHDIICRNRW